MKRNGTNRIGARDAYTLREFMVAMVISGMVISMTGAVLFRMQRQQTTIAVSAHQTGSWLRLARAFRSDVHAASDAEITGDLKCVLTITNATSEVIWNYDGQFVHRLSRETSSKNSTASKEQFVVPNASIHFELQDIEGRQLARLIAVTDRKSINALPVAHGIIEGAIGLHQFREAGL